MNKFKPFLKKVLDQVYPEIKLEAFHTHTESLCDGLLILEKKVNLRYLVSKPRVYEFYVMQGLFFQFFFKFFMYFCFLGKYKF